MELTRRELKELGLEEFKPYSAIKDRPYIQLPYNWVHGPVKSVRIKELVSRGCEAKYTDFNPKHIQRFGSDNDYDLHETKPYLDGSVQQINRLIDSITPQHLQHTFPSWQLSEAKLELISRN